MDDGSRFILSIDAVAKIYFSLLRLSRDEISSVFENDRLQTTKFGAFDPVGIEQFISAGAKVKKITRQYALQSECSGDLSVTHARTCSNDNPTYNPQNQGSHT